MAQLGPCYYPGGAEWAMVQARKSARVTSMAPYHIEAQGAVTAVRAATLTLFRGFDADAWRRRGRASGAPVTVASLPWIVLGHDLHHHAVLRERYGLAD